MVTFIDEKGQEHLVQAEIKTGNNVNGERSVTGEIYSNDAVIHAIGRGWKIEIENETYCITYALPVDDSKNVVVEFDAIHEFFFDFDKSVIYEELNGSHTFLFYLEFIFKNSGYSYRNEVQVEAFEKQSFGMKNRLALFKDLMNSTGVEYTVSGKVVRIVDKVGSDLSTIVKKGFNLQELRLEHNIGDFITYKKGYGAFIDPDDETKGRLEVEYKSPLAEIYGLLEGDPIDDERYTIADNLKIRLKNEVDNSYSVSVSLSMEDLLGAGYEQERPHAGDYIMAINEDIGFQEKVRIVSFTSSYSVDGELIDHQVTCNSISMASRQSKGDKAWKSEVQANLENAVTTAEHAAISANGKNKTFTGLFGPDGKGEPKATLVGDTWYKPNGEETEVYRWDGQSWEPLMSTKDNKIINEKITEVETEIDKAKKDSEKALSEAENSRQEAENARKQAFNSEQIANSAKQDAALAIQKAAGNAAQITTIDGKIAATSTKVDGNTAQIGQIQLENNRLNSTIGIMRTDIDGLDFSDNNLQVNSAFSENTNGWVGQGATVSWLNSKRMRVVFDSTSLSRVYYLDTLSSINTGEKFSISFKAFSNITTNIRIGSWENLSTPIQITNNSGVLKTYTVEGLVCGDSKALSITAGSGVIIQITDIMVVKGNRARDHQLSISDMTTFQEFSTFEQTTKGFQQTTTNQISGIKSEQTQMDNQITSLVTNTIDIINKFADPKFLNPSSYGVIEGENWTTSSDPTRGRLWTNRSGSRNRFYFNNTATIILEPNRYYDIKIKISADVSVWNLEFGTAGGENINVKMDMNTNAKWINETIKVINNTALSFWVENNQSIRIWELYVYDSVTGISSSQVIQLQDQITSTVNSVTTIDGKVNNQQSQITQLSNNINLKVDKNNVVAQINLSPEAIRLNAKWIHLSGTSLIDNAVIKSAMIDTITANKITTGTLNASNVNIINMNASNIVTGTISGANLRINLNSGEVLFNKGLIKKLDDSFIIDLDNGYITNKDPNRASYFLIQNGGVKFYDRAPNTGTTPVEFGSIASEQQEYDNKLKAETIIINGTNGVYMKTKNFNAGGKFTYDSLTAFSEPSVGAGLIVHNASNGGQAYLHGEKYLSLTAGIQTRYKPGTASADVYRSGIRIRETYSAANGNSTVNVNIRAHDAGPSIFTYSEINLKADGQSQFLAYGSLLITSGSTLEMQADSYFLKAGTARLYFNQTTASLNLGTGLTSITLGSSQSANCTIRLDGKVTATENAVFDKNLSVRGTKNAIHETSKGWVATPAYETAESYLGDIGTNTTDEDGNCTIFIESIFGETVNTKEYDYQVFLQSYSYGSNVFVITRDEKYFVVKSDRPSTQFTYEIKAKRKGYEKDRLTIMEEIKNVA